MTIFERIWFVFSAEIAIFLVIAIPLLIAFIVRKIRENRRQEVVFDEHRCKECVDFDPRIHKGYCYYREMPCKAYNKACPFIKVKQDGAA